MAGLDVAGSAVGIASIGIQVCQGLLSYYNDWRDYKSDIRNAYNAIADLSKTFGLLQDSLRRDELDEERSLRVKTCLESYVESLEALSSRLQELRRHSVPDGLRQMLLSKGQHMLYPFRTQTLTKLRQNVDHIQERLQLAVAALQLDAIITLEGTMARMAVQQQALVDSQQLEEFRRVVADRNEKANKFLQKLRYNAYDYDDARKRNDEPVAGTCRWFVSNSLFRDWTSPTNGQSPASPFLYTTADPGCGKSVLARYLIDKVLPQEGRTVCYSFFKDDFEDQKSSRRAVSALLHQLLLSNRHLLTDDDTVLNKCDAHGDWLFESFATLWEIFILASDLTDKETVCVLDALDECHEADRRQFLKAIHENRGRSLKILFTSRPYNDIRLEVSQTHTEKLPLIHLQGDQGATADEIEDEIRLVVRSRVDRVSRIIPLSSIERDLLQRQLDAIPNRNYLWITLVFDGLIGQHYITKKDILDLGRSLPQGLPDAYEKILAKSKDVSRTRKLLHIVLAARQPLTTSEMAVALAIDGQESWAEVEAEIIPADRINESVRSLCGLFVTVVDGKVYFLHQTAREFLIRDHDHCSVTISHPGHQIDSIAAIVTYAYSVLFLLLLRFIQIIEHKTVPVERQAWAHTMDPAESNAVLAEICMSRIQQGPVQQAAFWANKQRELILLDDSVYRYSAEFWSDHYNESTDTFQTAAVATAQALCSTSSEKTHWTQLYHPRECPEKGPPLCLASAFGLVKVAALILKLQDPSHDLIDRPDASSYWTPLAWAARKGCEDMVRLLIDSGATVDLEDEQCGKTPLSLAAEEGHEGVVQLLIDHGAGIGHTDAHGAEPLSWAVSRGHEGVVRTLVGAGAQTRLPDKDAGMTPISWAARFGHEGIVKFLMDTGADASLPDCDGRTPLSRAADEGHESVVRALISGRGQTTIDVPDSSGRTPLWYAVRSDHPSMVRLLINSGARTSINLPENASGETLMCVIAEGDYDWMLGMLLGSNAKLSIDLSKAEGRTPLWVASRLGHESMVRLLLDSGAKASIDLCETSNGHTPLTIAASYGHTRVVRLLIDSGADVNLADGAGLTPLKWAGQCYHAKTVLLLIERGAIVDRADHELSFFVDALVKHYESGIR